MLQTRSTIAASAGSARRRLNSVDEIFSFAPRLLKPCGPGLSHRGFSPISAWPEGASGRRRQDWAVREGRGVKFGPSIIRESRV
jgi:hypothetical protein